ncbi:YceI family protein [Massilia sp. W12]|uniref:YceI family protein n=1 Tax=Massilia sp. W12 TaxID=3126507 RepID=UPI0030D2F59A
MRIFACTLLAGGLLALPAAQAAVLKTDNAKSTIAATFKQMGVPVDAKFKLFSAVIDFDPAKPDTAKARVDLDVASIDLGAAEYNAEVGKPEWFNKAKFPKATFVSSTIKANSPTQLQVSGKLSIKGKTMDVSFPLSLKKEGNAHVFDGSLPIKRLAFNIGEGEWKDTGMVADEVIIKFHITAAP